MDYESDQAVQQIQDEMYQQEQSRPKSTLHSLSKQSKFFIGLFIAVMVYMYLNKTLEPKTIIIIGVAGAIVLFFISQPEPSRSELTYLECMIRLNDILKFLQKHPIGDIPQVPKGYVEVRPVGRKQWYEGTGFKRSYGVNIFDEEIDIVHQYFCEVDIFTGDIITFQEKDEGVTGHETKDIKLIPSFDTLLQKKRDQFLDKSWRRK